MAAVALSLKQPWATLLVHGLKSVEVRAWSTDRRGTVLVHAARVPDPRPQAWAHLPPDLAGFAKLGGGIVGAAELTGCTRYSTLDDFTLDLRMHLNDPAWFRPPALYGLLFSRPRVLPFRRLPGNVKFFPVPDDLVPPEAP